MLVLLRKRMDRLEREKRRLLDWSSRMSLKQLSFRPSEQEWSALQVLDHLIRVEAGVLRTAERGVKAPAAITLRDRFGCLAVNAVMLSPRRVKVPAGASRVLPGSDLELDVLMDSWHQGRLELAAFLETMHPDQLRGGVFRHSVAGWMNIPTTLDFLWAHLRHHAYQMKRLEQGSRRVEDAQTN